MITKKCCKCKKQKPLEDYHVCSSHKDGRQNSCKPCRKLVDAAKYRKRPKAQKVKYQKAARKREDEVRRKLLEYLRDHPCVDCGETDPVVLEFDHVVGNKEANVASLICSRAWPGMLKEIEKCVIRCANCHRRKTAKQFNTYKQRFAGETL